mgnify:CR=1 FL=1
MMELFHAAFSAVNFIPTALLVFIIFYWLLVIFGALDISTFDIEIEMEAEVEVDAEVEGDGNPDISVSWLNNVLSFFNIDKIPLMVFLTFLVIPMWLLSVTVNHMLGNGSFLFSLLLLLPIFIVSLLVAKPVTYPFVKIFALLDKDADEVQDLVGAVGYVVVSANSTRMGQGEMIISGSNYRINIKTTEGQVKRGDRILVVNHIKESQFYIVEAYETLD